VIAVGEYGFVMTGGGLQLLAPDGSDMRSMAVPFEGAYGAVASSGDTLLVGSDPGLWLYSPT
jgi:hypothetical protein